MIALRQSFLRGPFIWTGVSLLLWTVAAAGEFRAGTGRVDITPREPIWMAGYGNRNKPSEGVDQPLNLKVLAIQEDGHPAFFLVTADLIRFPRSITEKIAERLETTFGVPRENILAVASHTHTGPVVQREKEGMFDFQGKQAEVVEAYSNALPGKALEAAQAAMKDLHPVKIAFGRSQASFAMNRRIFKPAGVNFGGNPEGPVNREVNVLRLTDDQGTVRAVVFGYACHCTTLRGNCYRISGDWAGFAQEYIERAFPSATAFFITGCGADADPQPNGNLELARQHGLEMAGAVAQAIKRATTAVRGPIRSAFDHVDLPFAKLPSRDELERRLKDANAFVRRHAQMQLDDLKANGKLPESYPCPVQVWQFGLDLTLIAIGGEVVVDYALRLKRELPARNLWVAGYANDVFAYVPSVRVLLEGGYEADSSMLYYGLPTRFSNAIEDLLIQKAIALVHKAGG